MTAACWSCVSFFGFGPPAFRFAVHGILTVVAGHGGSAPGKEYIDAPFPVSGANPIVKRAFEVSWTIPVEPNTSNIMHCADIIS